MSLRTVLEIVFALVTLNAIFALDWRLRRLERECIRTVKRSPS